MRWPAIVGAVFAASACGWQRGWCGLGVGCGFDGRALMRRGVMRQGVGGHAGSTLAGMRFGWRAGGN